MNSIDASRCFIVINASQRVNGKLSLVHPELHPVPVKAPWHHLGIGPITPASLSGKRYILTMSDYCTKCVDAITTVDKSAHETARALFKVKPKPKSTL